MRIVALLPMKANSERVRGKNFRDLVGRPLFRWVLDTLLSVKDISRVVINTDACSILAGFGVETGEKILVRERRPELCGDLVSMNLVLADDIKNVDGDVFLMTHVTNPFLSVDTINRALDAYLAGLRNGTADSVFTVNKIQTRFYRHDGSPVNHDPDNLVRTQDLEAWYEENSNLYVFSRQSFESSNARIGKKPILLEMSKLEAVDIDEPSDWTLAEALALRAVRP